MKGVYIYAKLRTEKKGGNFENMLFGRLRPTSDRGLGRVGPKYHGALRSWASLFLDGEVVQ